MLPLSLFGRSPWRSGAKAAVVALHAPPALGHSTAGNPNAQTRETGVVAADAVSLWGRAARGLVVAGALAVGALGVGAPAHAQSTGLKVTPLSSSLQPDALVQALTGGASSGVSVSNVQFKGVNAPTGATSSAGLFTGGTGILGPGFESGVVLSNGKALDVIGPNNSGGKSSSNNVPGDPDLDGLLAGTSNKTNDATTLSFDFVPDQQFITFSYVFGSEEYNEFVGGSFNDVFGFFINGKNVATLPNTNTFVSINNVNLNKNSQFYRNNSSSSATVPSLNLNTQLDGLTVVLTVQAQVNPGVVNQIKLAVADAGDSALDSAVFIQSGTFKSVPPGLGIGNSSVQEGNSGLSDANFNITIAPPSTKPVTVQYSTADGRAKAGIDYVAVSGSLSFAPGETTKTIAVPIIGDTDIEGNDNFFVNLSNATGVPITQGKGTGVILNDDGNAPPILSDIEITTDEDVPYVFSTQVFDFAVSDLNDELPVSVRVETLPANGTLQVGLTNTKANPPTTAKILVVGDVVARTDFKNLRYVPNLNYNGTDTFKYNTSDGTVFADVPANVNITINSVEDAPIITKIVDVRINRNTSTGPLPFSIGDAETPSKQLVLSVSSDNPSLVPDQNIVLADPDDTDTDPFLDQRTVTVTPTLGEVGIANISISVTDEAGLTTTATFKVTVNGAPVLADSSFTVALGKTFFSQLLASDPNNDPLTYKVVVPKLPNGLTLSTSGLISGTPTVAGSFVAVVQVNDGADTTTARVFFTVVPPATNRAPVVDNQTLTAGLNKQFSQQLSGFDPDGDKLTYVVSSNSSMPPQMQVSPSGVLSGIPTQLGEFPFSLTVSDGKGGVVKANYLLLVKNSGGTSAGVDSQGPVITRNFIPQKLSRAQLAAMTLAGTVRDVASPGITPSGLNRMLYQLRRSVDGYAFDGQAFTPDVNQGYVPIPVAISGDTSATLGWSQSLSVLPSASILTPGRYSISILAQDNAGNYGITVAYFTITAADTGSSTSPSAGSS